MTAHEELRADRRASVPDRILYSVEEAADLLGLGRTFMFHLVATGEIESVKIGKLRKVPRAAIEDFVERLRCEQEAASRGHRSGQTRQASA